MNNTSPTDITADQKKNELTITWGDGHVSVYSFALLREACPCASCRGGHNNIRAEPDADVFLIPLLDAHNNQITDIQLVGNYAINITWGDGHRYGIYKWEYLRVLCPCDICRDSV